MAVFDLDSYECHRKTLALTGRIRVLGPSGAVEAYSKQKALKLREAIGVFTDESESSPLFFMQARQIFDLGATFDVRKPDGEPAGALRRKALKSMFKDEWLVLGAGDREIGTVTEDDTGRALARRLIPFVGLFLAQEYAMRLDGAAVAEFQRNRNPFAWKLTAQLTPGLPRDRKLMVLAAAVLLLVIEGSEN